MISAIVCDLKIKEYRKYMIMNSTTEKKCDDNENLWYRQLTAVSVDR